MLLKKIMLVVLLLSATIGFSQRKQKSNPTMITTGVFLGEVGPLKNKNLIPAIKKEGLVNPKMAGSNKVVPGKGLPKGKDPLISKQIKATNLRQRKAPEFTFKPGATRSDPSDPTGAAGPNHYVSALNSAFAIHDKNGNELVASSSLDNIWPGETSGDPIVFYDNFADRFVITQFDGSSSITSPDYVDNGFLIAVSKGPDPVNDGWYTYRFRTGNTFPDYPKFSVWSDGYYITANKDQNTQDEDEVIYVLERDKILLGDQDAQMVGFPLPGSKINGFYSPAAFNAIGNSIPPRGNAKIVYLQDDSWSGVTEDQLKFWNINVNWLNLEQSTIAEDQILNVSNGDITPFDSVFDGASFLNLPQPGGGSSLDVQQAVMMYATNYRRFCNYNSVVLNFAVDVDDRQGPTGGDIDNISGIRWYELRQNGDDQPWTVFQEGTYVSPDGKSAWCGSIATDIFGNIGMGYTTIGTVENGATADSFVSIRYTGRLANDPLGTMTFPEETIVVGTGNNNTFRYGDYAHLTVDPVDDQTFWHIGEYFEGTTGTAQNIVGVFKLADAVTNDVGVERIDAPVDGEFTEEETVVVTLRNLGTVSQTNIPVSYSINGGAAITEMFTGPLNAGETASFTFSQKVDLSMLESYMITAETNLTGDINPENDCVSKEVKNTFTQDVGIIRLISPISEGVQLTAQEKITIVIFNFGGAPQSNIPVFYAINSGTQVNEVFSGTLASQESVEYTFTTTEDFSAFETYTIELGTNLVNDENESNNIFRTTLVNEFCKPASDCSRFGDGITFFEIENVTNPEISCNQGYEDFTKDFTIRINKFKAVQIVTVKSGFADDNGAQQFSMWIDLNDNDLFETTELIVEEQIISEIDSRQNFQFSIPEDAALGSHLLRIRAGDVNSNTGAPLGDPCGSMQFGTTHDYTINIVEGERITKLIAVLQSENQFLFTKIDSNAPKEERIYIFNVLGQVIATNLVKKNDKDAFIYELDMSFARSGVYFARLGNSKKNVASFVVR